MKEKKEKEEKQQFVDDGRTIAPMNGDELPSYRRFFGCGRTSRKARKQTEKIELTKKEKRAAARAMLAMLLPRFAIILAGFALAFLLVWLWLL